MVITPSVISHDDSLASQLIYFLGKWRCHYKMCTNLFMVYKQTMLHNRIQSHAPIDQCVGMFSLNAES